MDEFGRKLESVVRLQYEIIEHQIRTQHDHMWSLCDHMRNERYHIRQK